MQRLSRPVLSFAPASLAITLWLAVASAAPAMDMGGGGGGGDAGGGSGGGGGGGAGAGPEGAARLNSLPSACAKGQVYDVKRSKCVKAELGVTPARYRRETG
jgi:hypothetical protein